MSKFKENFKELFREEFREQVKTVLNSNMAQGAKEGLDSFIHDKSFMKKIAWGIGVTAVALSGLGALMATAFSLPVLGTAIGAGLNGVCYGLMGSAFAVCNRMDKVKDHIVRDAKDHKRLGCVLATTVVGIGMVAGGFLISESGKKFVPAPEDKKVTYLEKDTSLDNRNTFVFSALTEEFQANSDRAIVNTGLTNTSAPLIKFI